MRAVHAVSTFLDVSENWIYPQIAAVPGVESRVLCDYRANIDTFPLPRSHVVCRQELFGTGRGVARLMRAVSRRIGFTEQRILSRIRDCQPNVLHAHFGTVGW